MAIQRYNASKGQVCKFWLQGKCSRNPCKFRHEQVSEQQAPKDRKFTWKNPNLNLPNKKNVLNTKVTRSCNAPAKKSVPCLTNEEKKIVPYPSEMKIVPITNEEKKSVLCPSEKKNVPITTEEKKIEIVQPFPSENKEVPITKDFHLRYSGYGFRLVTDLQGHAKPITGVLLPSGCDKLYSGSKDGTIRVWDCNTGRCINSVAMHSKVACLAYIAAAWLVVGLENVVKIWNLKDEKEWKVCFLRGSVCSMFVDEDLVFAGMEDGSIHMLKWNSDNNLLQPYHVLKGHEAAVLSFVKGEGSRLYSGSRDSTIRLWDVHTKQCLQTLRGHSSDVTSLICWTNYLISSSLDKTLKAWGTSESGSIEVAHDLNADHELMTLAGIHDCEEKPVLLCSYSDCTVRHYDLPSLTERGRIFSKAPVEVIHVGAQGLFFTGDASGELSVWKMHGAP